MLTQIHLAQNSSNDTGTIGLFSKIDEQKHIKELSKNIIDGVMEVLDKQLQISHKKQTSTAGAK